MIYADPELCPDDASQIPALAANMDTPNSANYGFSNNQRAVSGLTEPYKITVTVTADNDAHIFLSTGGTPTADNGYEIVLGGWDNSKSVIRTGTQSTERATISGTMVGGGAKTFTIEKTATELTVQKDGTTVLLAEGATLVSSEVWLMTGWGASAEWTVMLPGTAGTTAQCP